MINAKKAVKNVNNFKNKFNHCLEEFCNEVTTMANLGFYSIIFDTDTFISDEKMQNMFLNYVEHELYFNIEPYIFNNTYTISWRRDYIIDKIVEKNGRICAYGAYLMTYDIEDSDDKYIEEIAEDIEKASLLGERSITFCDDNWYRMNSVIAIMTDCGYMVEHIDGDTIKIEW